MTQKRVKKINSTKRPLKNYLQHIRELNRKKTTSESHMMRDTTSDRLGKITKTNRAKRRKQKHRNKSFVL